MKRDFDLMRKIMLAIESDDIFKPGFDIEDCTNEQFKYHCNLLYQRGFTMADDMSSAAGDFWQPNGLTWEGHDYIDAVRDDTKYNRVVKTLKDKGSDLSFEVIKAAVLAIGKAHVPGL